jgi:hypothetical protein
MDKPGRRALTSGWLYLPAVAGPISGVMIQLGGGSIWIAALVGTAPYALYMVPYSAFLIGYIAVVIRWVCGPQTQESMERLILLSANAVVGLLTLTRVTSPQQSKSAEERTRAGVRTPGASQPDE